MGVDPKHADQMVRGAAVLPNGTGKKVRVIAFAQGDKARDAQEALTIPVRMGLHTGTPLRTDEGYVGASPSPE